MKYFLALDKGRTSKNYERFIKINLASINEKLAHENNLQALCTFTSSFENETQLKLFLVAEKVVDQKGINYPLTITYLKDFNRSTIIPYKKDLKYLDYRYLEDIILKNVKSPEFLKLLVNRYGNYKHLSQEIYSLRGFLSNPFAEYKLYDVVRRFVNKICFRQKNGKQVINYKGLLDLGMLISRILEPMPIRCEINHKTQIKSEEQYLSEDDPRLHHLEELKERAQINSDDQMRLF